MEHESTFIFGMEVATNEIVEIDYSKVNDVKIVFENEVDFSVVHQKDLIVDEVAI